MITHTVNYTVKIKTKSVYTLNTLEFIWIDRGFHVEIKSIFHVIWEFCTERILRDAPPPPKKCNRNLVNILQFERFKNQRNALF